MKRIFVAAMIVLLAGCTAEDSAVRAVEAQGMTEVKTTGYRWLGCGEGDSFHTGFTAKTAQGKQVSGVVCSGILKGSTVRFD